MTQLSSNLIPYEQMLVRVNRLLSILDQRAGLSKEEIAEEYAKMVSEVRDQMGTVISSYDPFVKGEPPKSVKLNTFFADATQDLSLIARQLDYINAKTVDVFNLFSSEIEKEKRFSERIASKAKILQMYSRSPSEDIIYIGDSFDDDNLIDYTKITKGLNPLIKNGTMSLAITSSKKLPISSVTISDSNGFIGNNHQIIKSINSEGNEEFSFVFEKSEVVNNLNSIRDGNPLTYFEYEALNVDKASVVPAQSIPARDNEFKFIKDSLLSAKPTESDLIDWSSHNQQEPLEMTIEIAANQFSQANSIDIVPYFGSSKFIEVKEILIFDKTGVSENVISSPIYIGSSLVPLNLQLSKNYFYDRATIRFSQRDVLKAQITFRQTEYSNIEISHIYWKPSESNANNPFVDLERFNPDYLNRDIYEVVEFNRYELLPKLSNPTEFKKQKTIYKNINVSTKKKSVAKTFYVIEFFISTPTGSIDNIYFQQWLSQSVVGSPGEIEKVAYFTKDLNMVDDELVTKNYPDPTSAQNDYNQLLETYLNQEISPIQNVTNGGTITSISISEKKLNTVEKLKTHRVRIETAKENYSAKRWSIGLRDIEIYNEEFVNELEIVSDPFLFDFPVESIMLSIDSDIDDQMLKKVNVESYISVDNGQQWIKISPIQLDFSGTPEVIYFNQSILSEYRLSGASYFSFPQVPEEIKSVIVKIKINKDANTNMSPNIYGYQLVAKVKRS